MESLARYFVEAIDSDRGAFAARHPGLFLLKRPVRAAPVAATGGEGDDEGDEETTAMVGASGGGVAYDEEGPLAREWRVAEVKKTPGVPPAQRIVVGRARGCEVVLPFASVSKVHAHFHVNDGRVTHLSDEGSSNGTFVNGRRLEAGVPTPVRAGDAVLFGALALELVDAGALYDVLQSES